MRRSVKRSYEERGQSRDGFARIGGLSDRIAGVLERHLRRGAGFFVFNQKIQAFSRTVRLAAMTMTRVHLTASAEVKEEIRKQVNASPVQNIYADHSFETIGRSTDGTNRIADSCPPERAARTNFKAIPSWISCASPLTDRMSAIRL